MPHSVREPVAPHIRCSLQYGTDLQTLTVHIAVFFCSRPYSTVWQHQGLDTVATDHASNSEQCPSPPCIWGRLLHNVCTPLRVR